VALNDDAALRAAAEADALAADPQIATDRVWTVPNILSMLRLVGVPVFLVLILAFEADGWALAVLFLSGLSDWLDGKLARMLNQTSSLGALLDPLADRLYMVTTPLAFAIRDFVPWWVVILLFARDGILALTLPVLKARGLGPLPVTYIGKAATFALMYAFPMILAGQWDSTVSRVMLALGYAFLAWGLYMYLWSMVMYLYQTRLNVAARPRLAARE
jgi:cardiolipin synthase